MPRLEIHQVHLALPPDVFAAFEEELRVEGPTYGIFCIGAAPIIQGSLFMMWIQSGDVRVTANVPRSSFADADRARNAARDFVVKWKARGE